MKRFVATVGLGLLASAAPVLACPVCFQVEQGPVTSGVRAAVVVLMAVTTSVLGGFAAFILKFVCRSKTDPAGRFPHEMAQFAGVGKETDPRGRF